MAPFDSEIMRYAALIAHQLKAPVTAAMSLLQTVLGEFAGPLAPKQKDLLEKALGRCAESLQASQRLLAIADAMQKPQKFLGIADITGILRRVHLGYGDQATAQQVALTLEMEGLPVQVQGYEPALTEALEALVHNALKYTPDYGRVRLALVPGADPGTISVVVADSGVGITEKDRDKIFQPFFRTAAAQKSARPGTGLGLAFAKAVVEACGGSISVGRSDWGGAQFQVTLKNITSSKTSVKGDPTMPGSFKVVIIGGIAAGPKVAAKVTRLRPDAEVTIIDKGKLLSYSGCGLPFYIGGVVKSQTQLMSSAVGDVRDPIFFHKVKNVNILNQTEALKIDRAAKRILIRDNLSRAETWLDYDKLVLATGASPVLPPIPGVDLPNVFTLHGVSDAEGIKTALDTGKAHDVVIVGGGLIGIEMTEALTQKGCRVTIVESRPQILSLVDREMAHLLENHMESHGVRILTDTRVLALEGNGKVSAVQTDKGRLSADMVILATGISPNVNLARNAGLEVGITGGLKVDAILRTADPDIYAAGDCVENTHLVTGQPCYMPLGSIANKQGRVVAVNICGGQERFPGILATVACKVFECNIARTGLSEAEAKSLGYDVVTVLVPGPDREHFAPGSRTLMLKLVVDRANRRLLGAQAMGPGHADKRIDVASLAIGAAMTVDQVAQLDLCYAPQFSPVLDNIIIAANVARNKLDGYMTGMTAEEIHQRLVVGDNMILLDVRTPAELAYSRLPGSVHIPLGALRERMGELPRNRLIVAFCNYSLRGYEAALILRAAGYADVRVMDGGLVMWPYETLQS